jgi:hypothetical protein
VTAPQDDRSDDGGIDIEAVEDLIASTPHPRQGDVT